MELQVDAKASKNDSCLVVSFSSTTSAASYYRYLTESVGTEPTFLPKHDWNFTLSKHAVSMILPETIKIGQPYRFDVELVIPDDKLAKAWEKRMLLWTETTWSRDSQDRCFMLSQPTTTTDLEGRIENAKGSLPSTRRDEAPRHNHNRYRADMIRGNSNIFMMDSSAVMIGVIHRPREVNWPERQHEAQGNWLTRWMRNTRWIRQKK